jgi:uncharacterized protein (DUF58 family)
MIAAALIAAALIAAALIAAGLIAGGLIAARLVAVGRAAGGRPTERGLQAVRGQEAHPEPAPAYRAAVGSGGSQSGDEVGGSHVPTISRSVEAWRPAAHDAST